MTAFLPVPGGSGVGALSIPSFFLPSASPLGTVSTHDHLASQLWPPSLGGSCGARGPWAGTTSPQLCMHLGKEDAQESMGPVLWSRLGAKVQGGLGPIPVLTCKLTFRATLRPSPLCSLSPPEPLGNGQEGVAWGGLCAPQRGHEKEDPSSLCSYHRHSQCGGKPLLPISQRRWKVPKRFRIELSITQFVFKVGLKDPLRGSP